MNLDRFDYLKLARSGDIDLGRSQALTNYNEEYCVDMDYFKMPRCVDIDNAVGICFRGCDFSKTEELSVSEARFVRFDDVFFPKKIDLSKCNEVLCGEAYGEQEECLDGLEEIKFKNKAQADDFFYEYYWF